MWDGEGGGGGGTVGGGIGEGVEGTGWGALDGEGVAGTDEAGAYEGYGEFRRSHGVVGEIGDENRD